MTVFQKLETAVLVVQQNNFTLSLDAPFFFFGASFSDSKKLSPVLFFCIFFKPRTLAYFPNSPYNESVGMKVLIANNNKKARKGVKL